MLQVFNALLVCIAKSRDWEKALHVFKHMNNIGVPADTTTYNALLEACMNGTLQHRGLLASLAGCWILE